VPSLTQSNRAFRLHWGSAQSSLEQVLIAHRIDISEGLCSGIVGHVTCLSTRADLPLNAFIGLPLSVQMVTDRGALHPICAIVTDARAFDFDLSSLDRAKYPVRETLLQFHESDADFIRRLCRRVWLRGSLRRASGARRHRLMAPVSRRFAS
jgi:uncharacterized protein involved in type VI secretion and phage assembly